MENKTELQQVTSAFDQAIELINLYLDQVEKELNDLDDKAEV